MTLTESLVSSFILIALATQSGRLFGDSIQALGKSRLRDYVNAAINRDIENVRQTIAAWGVDTSMATNGQLAYWPDETHCDAATLATALLSENTETLPASSSINLNGATTPLQGINVIRTISAATGNTNLIQVNYFTSGSSALKTEISTTLAIPAQGWCPT